MKSILFAVVLALSFTTALAEKNTDTGISEAPAVVSFFKQHESNIVKNTNTTGYGLGRCFKKCMNDYHRCLRANNGRACERLMEICTSACVN